MKVYATLVALALLPVAALAAKSRDVNRITRMCKKELKAEGVKDFAKQCACLATEIKGISASDAEIRLLAGTYEHGAKALAEIQKPEYVSLLQQDFAAVDKCIDNPAWIKNTAEEVHSPAGENNY